MLGDLISVEKVKEGNYPICKPHPQKRNYTPYTKLVALKNS